MTAHQAQAASALLLALASGSVDAVSYTMLHHIFTANMTGNTTELGIAVGLDSRADVVPLAVAVAVFATAIGLASALIELTARRGLRATAAPVLALEAAIVCALMVYGLHVARNGTAPDHSAGGFYVLLVLAVVAMGAQTASLTKAFGQTLRTTYVSGLLTAFSQEILNVVLPPPGDRPSYLRDELSLGGRRESLRRLSLRLGVYGAFLAGAIWGGFGEPRWTTWPLLLAIAAILAASSLDLLHPLHENVHCPPAAGDG